MRAAVEHLDATTARDLATLASELTRAALMGARGNSGVIFSQILRGFAEVVGQAERLDAPTLARAFRGASDAAYRAVRKPVEGTMLTVIREMAEEAEAHADETARELLAAVVRAAPTPSSERPSCSTSCARPASSTREARGCSRSCAASRPRSPARRFPRRRRNRS